MALRRRGAEQGTDQARSGARTGSARSDRRRWQSHRAIVLTRREISILIAGWPFGLIGPLVASSRSSDAPLVVSVSSMAGPNGGYRVGKSLGVAGAGCTGACACAGRVTCARFHRRKGQISDCWFLDLGQQWTWCTEHISAKCIAGLPVAPPPVSRELSPHTHTGARPPRSPASAPRHPRTFNDDTQRIYSPSITSG